MDLDEPEGFGRIDPADALGDIESTPSQWARARDLADVRPDLSRVDAVVLTGMGGSGIAGDVAAALAAGRLDVPLVVHKGYGLPRFVGPRTQVVACSYSGETEETLSAVDAALAVGAPVLAVTSGGALAERCERAGAAWVRVPAGPQPRHALGLLAVPVLVALGLDEGLGEALEVQAGVLEAGGRGVPTASSPPKQLALRLAGDTVPLAWGAAGLGALAAYRLKCQLNENAKLPAFCSQLPELDHNEVVGLSEPSALDGHLGLVLMRDPTGEHPRNAVRFAVTREVVRDRCAWAAEVQAIGESPLARLASLLLLADLASVYTALALDRDPTPIVAIDRLKRALAGEPLQA